MANTRSDVMANLYTDPMTMTDGHLLHSRLRTAVVTTAVAGTESASHFFPQCRFQALDRILDVKILTTDLGTTLTMDLGLYLAEDWSVGDATEKDVDIWADGQDFGTAIVVPTSILGTGGAASIAPATYGRAVHTDAGDAAYVAGTEYDAAWKIITTGTPGAGTVKTVFYYVSGG